MSISGPKCPHLFGPIPQKQEFPVLNENYRQMVTIIVIKHFTNFQKNIMIRFQVNLKNVNFRP